NGPLGAPAIDIEEVREVSDATVGIKVSGPAREPELTPFSEPPLPDDEIIFRMVTGRVPGTKTTSSENQLIAQALVSSGIKFGGASISETAEKLGIQNFNVGTGDESDLLVSGYLDPSLYVEYGVNALGDGSTFKVRWDFARQLSLEMIGGLQSSLDLLYTREF
ncbi:MAG: translocation/assembly module TamB domain-containing protein, partial [Gammaproteobacteria bacterium]|nr:translocation/assembly module TamB domain-containing protein [Gammaproteobacteria bacterium]